MKTEKPSNHMECRTSSMGSSRDQNNIQERVMNIKRLVKWSCRSICKDSYSMWKSPMAVSLPEMVNW